jgi:predicted Fe-Mo cluster-binding NifX family protein
MKAAFSYMDNRIAPVFDTARNILVVEAVSRKIMSESKDVIADNLPVQKAIHFVEMGVDSLVCGAISRPLYDIIVAYGIQVAPFIAGDLRQVVVAWTNGRLREKRFAMPGCGGIGRQRFRRMQEKDEERSIMNGKKGGGGGQGQGRGGGQGTGTGSGTGQGQGRGGRRAAGAGGAAAGPGGYCVCLSCGERAVHERGVPCINQKCSKCGASMTRE